MHRKEMSKIRVHYPSIDRLIAFPSKARQHELQFITNLHKKVIGLECIMHGWASVQLCL